jgi:uncharacterized membrane protein
MSRKKKKKRNIAKTTNTQKSNNDKTADKKAIVMGTDKKSRFPLIAIILSAVFIAGGVYYAVNSGNSSASYDKSNFSMNSTASKVTYPVSLFDDNKARHYVYKGKDVTIKYFILKSSDGIIRAAYDACDVCWPAGKGYYQDGDVMVCRNCGRRFASVLVNVVKGGCNPAPLKRRIEGDQLVIHINDILEGKQYFNFSGKV